MEDAGGSATPLALLLVTAIMVCVALAYRRLGARYPNAGSAYTWVRIAFGAHAGAYAAWVLIVANLFAIVATALPAGIYTLALLGLFVPGVPATPLADGLVGAAWVLGAGLLLYCGLRPTSRVANALGIAGIDRARDRRDGRAAARSGARCAPGHPDPVTSRDLDLLAAVVQDTMEAANYSPAAMRKANRHDLDLLLRRLALTRPDARRILGLFRRILFRLGG